jgi:hypothetical protein
MKSKNGVDISFTKDFEVELVGDFSSDLSPNLERMRASKTSFTVDEFIEAIFAGYECDISQETLLIYIDTLDFDSPVSERIKKELVDFVYG